jgi:hypothetical protein
LKLQVTEVAEKCDGEKSARQLSLSAKKRHVLFALQFLSIPTVSPVASKAAVFEGVGFGG